MMSARMPGAGKLVGRMIGQAQALAQTRAQAIVAQRRGDPARWRKAGLLWPLFTKD